MNYREYIANRIQAEGVSAKEIEEAIAVPPNTDMGDYALPCFKFAKVMRKPPVVIANELAAGIAPDGVIAEVTAGKGGFHFLKNKKGGIVPFSQP